MHDTTRGDRLRAGRHGRSALAVAGALALAGTMAPAAQAEPSDNASKVTVNAPATAQHWDPLTDHLWRFAGNQLIQTRAGTAPAGPRRPFEYAIVTKGPELSSVDISARVRIDEPIAVNNRDVIVIWNYQSPTRFYYAHLSQDNTIYPHNGIFVVDDADRRRIDDQWNGSVGAAPAITDEQWHRVRIEYDADSGEIGVHLDGSDTPLMTATDTTFSGGRMGFGSFDNFGRVSAFKAVGQRAD